MSHCRLEELKNECERVLVQNLATDNVCTLLIIADMYNAARLRQRAVAVSWPGCAPCGAFTELCDLLRLGTK